MAVTQAREGAPLLICPIRGASGAGGWGETPHGRGLPSYLQAWLGNVRRLSLTVPDGSVVVSVAM